MTNSFSSTDQVVTPEGTGDSQVNAEQTAGNQYSVAGKSFQDLDAMKNSYENQESHINTLETERAADRQRIQELEAKVSQASTVDELLERIQSGRQVEGGSDIDINQIAQQVASQVESGLQAKELEGRQDNNWKKVSDTLTAAYGDKVDEQVKAIAKTHDMSWDDAVAMARTRPTIFLSLFKGMDSVQQVAPTSGTINTSALGEVERETPKTSVMNLRTDAERVANYNARLDAVYAEHGIKI